MKKSIRGYNLEIAVSLFRYRIACNITPLAWNKPMLCVPAEYSHTSWHFNFGPFHLWGMRCSNLVALEIDVNYLYFWWDKPRCPETMKRIF